VIRVEVAVQLRLLQDGVYCTTAPGRRERTWGPTRRVEWRAKRRHEKEKVDKYKKEMMGRSNRRHTRSEINVLRFSSSPVVLSSRCQENCCCQSSASARGRKERSRHRTGNNQWFRSREKGQANVGSRPSQKAKVFSAPTAVVFLSSTDQPIDTCRPFSIKT